MSSEIHNPILHASAVRPATERSAILRLDANGVNRRPPAMDLAAHARRHWGERDA
jgi:hypothetical protein